MSSSTGYHLVGEPSDRNDGDDDSNSIQLQTAMGYRLGVFRACYVVALCSIGSFLFAYVCCSNVNVFQLTHLGYWYRWRCIDVEVIRTRLWIQQETEDISQLKLCLHPSRRCFLWLLLRLAHHTLDRPERSIHDLFGCVLHWRHHPNNQHTFDRSILRRPCHLWSWYRSRHRSRTHVLSRNGSKELSR